MKIIHCPKGGRIPDGYCRYSCLNFPKKDRRKHQEPFGQWRKNQAKDPKSSNAGEENLRKAAHP